MPVAIDPQFSVYHLAERVQQTSTLLSHRRTMSLVSYEIENATLIDGVRTRIFAAFQYYSKFLPQLARYTTLALRAESIYVFGVPDVTLPALPNVTYIPLKRTDQLAKEWFLISYGREYFSALATEELTSITDPDHTRKFKGIWTFDVSMVSILEDWLSSAVDAQPLNVSEKDLNFDRQIRLMSNTMERLTRRIDRLNTRLTDAENAVAQELSERVNASLAPTLQARR
ncbi:MAG: DICT sensory domain-containing protein [bacterium]|nr:DICT sensory domain-containing protein [bacterium]